jgi:hypothetical protein
MGDYALNQEAAIAAVTANTAFEAYDADSTQRIKKATATQIGTFLGTFGGSTGTFGTEGNLNVQALLSAGAVSPGATGADNVLAVYTLPANALSAAGKMILITAAGSFAATSNNKTVKLIFNPATAVVGSTVGTGGTTICSTGVVTTSGTGWQLEGAIIKVGAANSNTQLGLHNQAQIGAAVASMLAPSFPVATENAAILIAVTGNAATATTDILFNFLEVNAMN